MEMLISRANVSILIDALIEAN